MTKSYLTIIIIWLSIILIQSCYFDRKTPDPGWQNLVSPDSIIEPVVSWPDNNKSKTFKIDSSDFGISASMNNWRIRLERKGSFESQFKKISRAFNKISKESNLNMLNSIGIDQINDELLLDIAFLPEVQKELREKSENGIVNSMGIVSLNAHKSRKLKEITDLFKVYNLEPYNYYIDKCQSRIIAEDTTKYSMYCASIHFELRKVNEE